MQVLIAEDEALARERLARLLGEFEDYDLVGMASDGREAVQMTRQLQPDIVLLDVRMPEMDGIAAAQEIRELPSAPAIIFCTAFDDQALAAFEAAALDYLLKPIKSARLEAALERAQQFIAGKEAVPESGARRAHLCARKRGNLELVRIEDVLYLRAEHKYVTVGTATGEVLIEEALKDLEEEFADFFLRIHRNALVSRKHIAGLEKDREGRWTVRLENTDRQLEVSRRNLPLVRRLIKRL